jgi:hypothetical protein
MNFVSTQIFFFFVQYQKVFYSVYKCNDLKEYIFYKIDSVKKNVPLNKINKYAIFLYDSFCEITVLSAFFLT